MYNDTAGFLGKIPERRKSIAHIGLFGVGLDVYWGQFPFAPGVGHRARTLKTIGDLLR
ncbi:MAG: hypothetical protein JW934_17825 [Anaerolineae bacterium]|nr:hypothetical protein [Anaerolineae bacterium]